MRRNKKEKATAAPLDIAIAQFIQDEVKFGKGTILNTEEFEITAHRDNGCELSAKNDFDKHSAQSAKEWFANLTTTAEAIAPKATAILTVYWRTGGHSVAFAGRSSSTGSHLHRKVFTSPRDYEKWLNSSDGKSLRSLGFRWTCHIKRR